MKRFCIYTLFMFVFFIKIHAQQSPHFTQYLYNMNIINPAYAGSKKNLSLSLFYRKQWIEVEGSPTTATFSGSMPLSKNLGIGLSALSDKIGPVTENNMYTDISYTLALGEKHRLAFGIKGDITFHRVGLQDIGQESPFPEDPLFSENTTNSFMNIGIGSFYYTENYYLALSIPNMIKNTYLNFDGKNFGSQVQHYFITGGYVFNMNQNTELKPSFMIKSAFNVRASIDLSLNARFNKKFEIGASYRLEDSFAAMVNYTITPSIRIGYAYDHIISDLKISTSASHEIMLLFDLDFPKKVSRSQRYF